MVLFDNILIMIMLVIGSSQFLWFFIVFYLYLCLKIQRYFMHANRDLTRLQAISKSPVSQIFSETLNGITSLRIFSRGDEIKKDYQKAMNTHFSNEITLLAVSSWFTIRIDMMGLIVIIPGFYFAISNTVHTGLVAVMLKYVLDLSGYTAWLLRVFTE